MPLGIELLAGDYIPDDISKAVICSIVDSREKGMRLLDEHLALLIIQQEEVSRQKIALQRSNDVSRALLSPVRKLLPEILGLIFIQCLPDKESTSTSTSLLDAPLLLMRVCRRWSNIARSTPQLWTIFRDRSPKRSERFLPMWLKNSGCLPVFLSILFVDEEGNIEGNLWENSGWIVELLVNNLHRWGSITLTVDDEISNALGKPRDYPFHMPSLEEVSLKWHEKSDPAMSHGLEGFFHAPNLRNMVINDMHLARLVTFDPNILSHLSIHSDMDSGLTLDDALSLDILHSCPNITKLNLFIIYRFQCIIDRKYSLPQLNSFCIHVDRIDQLEDVLHAIQAPQLREFELIHFNTDDEWNEILRSVTTFFIAKERLLEKLTLIMANGDYQYEIYLLRTTLLLPLLKPLTNLRSLRLEGVSQVELMKELTGNPSSHPRTCLCPQLRSLDLLSIDVDLTTLIHMVQSRRPDMTLEMESSLVALEKLTLRIVPLSHVNRARFVHEWSHALDAIAKKSGGLFEFLWTAVDPHRRQNHSALPLSTKNINVVSPNVILVVEQNELFARKGYPNDCDSKKKTRKT
ncbi:hypothetical protein BU17DRAFT_61174 [Hysterangium stoloniferum]|nr:hypothetical protein BU17DRAFT_61174 [Hysterangium stoloniferum]